MKGIVYFGTSISDHGHYFWNIENGQLQKTNWLFDLIPFDPYIFAKLPLRGSSTFLQKNGWSVIGFHGSPKDTRNGAVSVFFTKRLIDFDVFLREILSHDCAQEIINKLNELSK